MFRKRHFFSWRRRSLRFFASFLPLKERLISFFEFVLQTVRIWSDFVRTGGTAPTLPSGKNAWRSGWAPALPTATVSSNTIKAPIPSPARIPSSPWSIERARFRYPLCFPVNLPSARPRVPAPPGRGRATPWQRTRSPAAASGGSPTCIPTAVASSPCS